MTTQLINSYSSKYAKQQSVTKFPTNPPPKPNSRGQNTSIDTMMGSMSPAWRSSSTSSLNMLHLWRPERWHIPGDHDGLPVIYLTPVSAWRLGCHTCDACHRTNGSIIVFCYCRISKTLSNQPQTLLNNPELLPTWLSHMDMLIPINIACCSMDLIIKLRIHSCFKNPNFMSKFMFINK